MICLAPGAQELEASSTVPKTVPNNCDPRLNAGVFYFGVLAHTKEKHVHLPYLIVNHNLKETISKRFE